MKKLVSIISVVLIMAGTSFATNVKSNDKENAKSSSMTTSINGSVIDKNTGEALAGVKIILNELNQAVYTDFEGNFEFDNVSKGKYTIKAELISYKDKSVNVDLNKDEDVKIEVEN